ncbi:hypothetical protein [Shewanella khirikhana]|uniref:Uncharacterized protein n=1 Tax=Shewanella khirikhana TaxID=1965282 RepID=A0ABM8HK25_9GAMM|nr:hypothetical protein [Shewanella khirikhana]AZQ13298.1 hypothetical protein STH12_04272 [Shewanella khirikhana]
MELNVLSDVLTLSLQDIEELLATTKQERSQGFIIDQQGQKSIIDVQRFDEVIGILQEAVAVKGNQEAN